MVHIHRKKPAVGPPKPIKIEEKKEHRCFFCGKTFQSKGALTRHKKKCMKNK